MSEQIGHLPKSSRRLRGLAGESHLGGVQIAPNLDAPVLGQSLGGTVGTIVSYTSVANHFNDFPTGVVNTKDVLYYLTMVAAGLVLSTLSLQARRSR